MSLVWQISSGNNVGRATRDRISVRRENCHGIFAPTCPRAYHPELITNLVWARQKLEASCLPFGQCHTWMCKTTKKGSACWESPARRELPRGVFTTVAGGARAVLRDRHLEVCRWPPSSRLKQIVPTVETRLAKQTTGVTCSAQSLMTSDSSSDCIL